LANGVVGEVDEKREEEEEGAEEERPRWEWRWQEEEGEKPGKTRKCERGEK
jgi:hypothetical protein